MQDTQQQYHKIWLSDFFHQFPHVNFTWPWADSAFSTANIPYFHVSYLIYFNITPKKQSDLFIVPVFMLIDTFY